ncbi:MAG: hypothetical protein OXF98_13195 [Rhodospirillaceae bacterium]|nr:hypothetical protein [Rhodospirillaceae bacterium]
MVRKHYRSAVAAKCADCIFDPLAGGSRYQQIAACTAFECPLWPVRPLAAQSDTQYNPWPEKVTLSIMFTTRLSREDVEAWRRNPLVRPPVESDE